MQSSFALVLESSSLERLSVSIVIKLSRATPVAYLLKIVVLDPLGSGAELLTATARDA
jgi:hypothetical protein